MTNPWHTFLGMEHGPVFANALRIIALMPLDEIEPLIKKAIGNIQAETTLGPLMDPTAYQGGERFDNAHHYINVMRKFLELRRAMEDTKGV